MGAEDELAAASRRFVAQPGQVGIGPNWSPKRAYLQMYGFLAVLVAGIGLVGLVLSVSPESKTRAMVGLGAAFGFVLLVLGALTAYYRRHNRQEILVAVAGDGLTVSTRPGAVFLSRDVSLGPWGWGAGATGTALHLRSGHDRFVLGGRDHRVGRRAQLDEAPVPGVDAWLWAAEFDELLAALGGRAGPGVDSSAPGEPARCVLFPNPQRVQAVSPSAVREQHRLLQSASSLALDVGPDAIRVIDPDTSTLLASASPARVTATPATYRVPYGHWYPSLNNVVTDIEVNYLSTAPLLVVTVPGMRPLTIACVDTTGGLGVTRRFSWRDDVPVQDEPAEYAVSATDWQMLVDKLGGAAHLETLMGTGAERAAFISRTNLSPATPTSPLGNRKEHAMPSRRRRGDWGTIVGCSIASVLVIALGAFPVWVQHFGVPTRITVQYCAQPSSHSHLFDYVWDYAVGTCHWETPTRVEVWGAHQNDMGREIDVHTVSGEDIVDGWKLPSIVLGAGCLLGAGTVIAAVRRLRRVPT